MMGKFSITKCITPHQIMRNIISYHREMVIAKNKMLILLLPESLIASDTEDKIYKMAADGVLLVDDTEDANSQKMANIRMLNANMGQYISELTSLMDSIKQDAWEVVDMNAQRYGEIAQSAGVSVTQEAIARSSMGSVIIVAMFDEMRRHDYQRDLDYAKLAYIDGLQTSCFDDKQQTRYLSLDVESYVNSDYSVMVKNDQKELDKIQQLRQWAFSAAQNGDLDMAIAAITGNNVTQIKDTVNKFMEIKRQHEEQMKQVEQMIEQEKLQAKLAEIEAKGQQDRQTQAEKYQYEMQLKYMDVDMAMLNQPADDSAKYINSQVMLAGKTLHLVEDSPAILRINNLMEEIGDTIYVNTIEKYGAEQLIALVAHADIDYAVCDHHIAVLAADSLPNIDISIPIGFTQFYSWGMRKDSPVLCDSINQWLDIFMKSSEFRRLSKKYAVD